MDKWEKEFISRLELEPDQFIIKLDSRGRVYELDAVLVSGKILRFGSVRFNVRGQDPGKLTVYAVKGHDPEERFKCQESDPKRCIYKFWPDDDEAMSYAARVVKSAYGNKVR